MTNRDGPPVLRTLGDRLTYLFETVREPGSRPSYRAVAEAIKSEQGVVMSAQYINQLANGERENPGLVQLTAIATYFGVTPGYLLGEHAHVERFAGELQRLAEAVAMREQVQQLMDDTMQEPAVQQIVLRARGVSPAHLELVAEMLAKVRRMEGLDDADGDESSPQDWRRV
ncbi:MULTISPECIES: helix-turn-helix transcriptional regulator [Asanoa]|uniref:HTH cro/C1-type domain-containing protein n=2 Tax=Asanoa TaxID=195964 RepID=A0A239PFC2_9ACTN|nr:MULTISPECIES: helix-turn-helix transcriptional regulator [Asanoa]GIF74207.1 hypothetical protein Asi02nite_37250 [Asanoa siamensis]SNT65722.1 hypothetical protein SAMN05421812_12565 [Asanoa hainanensis]